MRTLGGMRPEKRIGEERRRQQTNPLFLLLLLSSFPLEGDGEGKRLLFYVSATQVNPLFPENDDDDASPIHLFSDRRRLRLRAATFLFSRPSSHSLSTHGNIGPSACEL